MIIKKYITEILITTGVVLLLLRSSDPVMYTDSLRYIFESLLDPPLYSTIIEIMISTFGSFKFAMKAVIIFQTLLIGFGIFYFTRTLAIHFNFDTLTKTLVSIFLFLPIIKFYNNLLTEPISYAFSLLFVSFVVKLIYNFNNQNLVWTTFFVIALLLTRNQFIFLYPIILLLYIGIFIQSKKKITLTWLITSFLSIFLFHNSLIFLNTYAKQDSLKTESLTYVNSGPFNFTYIDAIYVSTTEDVQLFENENLKKILTLIFKEMDDRKALVKYYNGRGHFGLSLREIKDYSETVLNDLAVQENTNVISLKREISIKLIKSNFGKYIKHIFKKFYDSTWLFVFVPFFMLLAGIISFLKYKSRLSLLILFISIFSLANHSVVYLFGRVQPRYLIYTDFILLIFIFIILNIFLQKNEKNIIK